MVSNVGGENISRYINFLKSIPIFRCIDDKTLENLSNKVLEITYSKGDMICKKDTYANNVYVIKSGSVTEFAMDDNEFSVMIKYSIKGEYFGDLGVLLDNSYVTTVIASAPTTILVIQGSIFCEIVWENKEVMKTILKIYRKRLQNSAQKFMSCTMFNSEGRLAYILMMIHNDSNQGKFVSATQETLSIRCGISRQTVSMILNNWKRCDIVNTHRGKIEIIDRDALTDILLNSSKSC
ncbi:MAG: Crp/Fnr family transcriptional regulator [Clostridium sp.]|uniref:Crp/Fnr family transcriptional regulator n=1 Tax=Clostridium sp. TaxID=1506 RepID=UPI003063D091